VFPRGKFVEADGGNKIVTNQIKYNEIGAPLKIIK
jgi:hypothetical protein